MNKVYAPDLGGAEWLRENAVGAPQEIVKPTERTRAWFAVLGGRDVFAKWYPAELQNSWAKVEIGIAGGNLHPAIVPLRQIALCADGVLLIYDRVRGENLGPSEARKRFAALPLAERAAAVLAVSDALAALYENGFAVVDWYEGNMIYDFDARQIWLFDWELCREGDFFILEMDSNYGSSRLMAPEEFVRGSRLDQITLVFNVGRYALLSLPEWADALAPVLARAAYPARSGRYQTLCAFAAALREEIAPLTNGTN